MDIEPDLVYLNTAAIGLLPIKTRDKLIELTQIHSKSSTAGFHLEYMDTKWEKFQLDAAQLLNGDSQGIVATNYTASGLQIVADGIQHKCKYGNIVINDLEFTTNVYIWHQLAKRNNIELRVVNSKDGRLLMDEFEREIDENTRLVAVSSVQSVNGFRVDLKR
ncbi:MAG: aminotransferase class V-fold PLP-dependent enzyme, partial [Candidatus Heimdallarchaeota archaeon]|nr:aminotransferase class V-fold PLP-dependent enzyme [Candidatus Heimdallarchaeota archaeon]